MSHKSESQLVGVRQIARRLSLSDFEPMPIEVAQVGGVTTAGELFDRFGVHLQSRRALEESWSGIRATLEQFQAVLGHLRIEHCTPRIILAWQDQMIKAGRARRTINRQVSLLRRAFKWGASVGLVDLSVYTALSCVEQLHIDQSKAKEMEKIKSVDDAIVDATLPFLREPYHTMVRVQRLTGCRPSEVCRLCPIEIDRAFRPGVWGGVSWPT